MRRHPQIIKTVLILLFTLFLNSVGWTASVDAGTSTVEETIHIKQSSKPASKDETSSPSSLSLGELRRKYKQTFKFKGPHVKQVALTFDDVPDPRFTPQVLQVLRSKGVKATFFIVGNRAVKHPDLVRQINNEGHALGNHSYSHPVLKKMKLEQFMQEILKTEDIIYRLTGKRPKIIRPPYGEVNEEEVKWAKDHHYMIVNWNVDSLDWKGLDQEKVKKNVLSEVGPGAIVLQHAGGGTGSDLTGTIKALPQIIDQLRSEGYTFVTVPELLGIPSLRVDTGVDGP
ncbi:polysaccharide deacetylase family protein [Paenibacillus sp. CAA11]|uniref:polysaccharide deacetylase family protein n=1 Tax=Paenibacillus sp. CAA11 TaxID=1532905 RepID=UPI000D373876|nr:polysaccharide deacetylase family protein [Paenibacillus sp. CAA11]AWB44820.1 polysaccharide deacetylase family protein [Paenibacillus sp. CAA11]